MLNSGVIVLPLSPPSLVISEKSFTLLGLRLLIGTMRGLDNSHLPHPPAL